MESKQTACLIEHHAMMFAYLCKHAMETCGEEGKSAILEGMTRYGNERGARMAKRALAHEDPLTTMTNQAYGEWKTDYDGQMDFGQLRSEPTFQTYIRKCAWCEAWEKHGILEYGKYYCVNVDKAVYQGFREDFVCTPLTTSLSFGGEQCEFDWGHPLTPEDLDALAKKKAELGTSCMKDFNFHTAHLKYTLSRALKERLGERAEGIIRAACEDFRQTFGQEYLNVLDTIDPAEF